VSQDFDDSAEAVSRDPAPGLLTILWRRKAYLLLGVVVGLIFGYLDYLRRDRVYQSTAQLYVQKRKIDPMQQPGVLGGLGSDSRTAFIDDFLLTQETLIKSNEVLSRAAAYLEKGTVEMPPVGGDYAAFIASGLTVSRVETGRGTSANILNISFRGPSSRDCETVVNAVIEAYKDSLSQGVKSAAEGDLERWRTTRIQLDKDLETCEQEYLTARAKSQAVSPVALTDIKSRINQHEGKRYDLDLRKRDIDDRLLQVAQSRKKGEDLQSILEFLRRSNETRNEKSTEVRKTDDPAAALRVELESLLESGLGKDHPQVVALRNRIEKLGQIPVVPVGDGVDEQINLIVRAMTDESKTLERQIKYIDTEILEKDRKSISELEKLHVDEIAIGDKRDRLRRRLLDAEEREKQISLTIGTQLYDARAINPAGPGGKIAPVLFQCLLIAMALGLVGGGGLAYLAELTDKSFRGPEDIRRRLGLAVVGHIPAIPASKLMNDISDPVENRVVVHHQSKSTEAEAYRGVRTALYFSTRGKGHQVIQVTSPNPGDGKSTLCANLAVAIAQSGKRVVLIDCDFRKPRVHTIFGTSADIGLASVIAGESDLPHAIQQSTIAGLSLLPCGPRPANPAELLTSQRFQDLLEDIKKSFDFVLIDTPPLLAVSDPAVVAPRVDGVLLTMRITGKVRPAAERAKETLITLGANVVGVVVNNLNGGRGGAYGSGNGYGYKYSNSYGYADNYGDPD
jgi:capsular exopolysaccharide synthesis family protein